MHTLQRILFLREELEWKVTKIDRFIAAVMLGALHGESHRSSLYLSNRMPRTISTKPDYSIRWWDERGLKAPKRDAFLVLRELVRFRFRMEPARLTGRVRLGDARKAHRLFPSLQGRVKLIVTSPPYLDVTDYAEDQWLRLWLLGGKSVPESRQFKDDRLTNKEAYWAFLRDVWTGVDLLLARESKIVVRIGGRQTREELTEGLNATLRQSLKDRCVRLIARPFTSEVKGRQTNIFRPGAGSSVEHDFVYSVH